LDSFLKSYIYLVAGGVEDLLLAVAFESAELEISNCCTVVFISPTCSAR